MIIIIFSCYQCVKDKNFESNSQQPIQLIILDLVVISVSKIKISKAIHNSDSDVYAYLSVVISVSKIKISKAIHNLMSMIFWTI